MIKLFLDIDGTLANFNIEKALERFAIEKDFFLNLLPFEHIDIIDRKAIKRNIYIISASPNIRCDLDKMNWIRKYIPNLPLENIVICRIGDNKAEVIQKKLNIIIDEETYLLDDYTKNLIDWESFGGKGIKRITDIADNSTKKWKGLELKDLAEIENLL